MSDRYRDWVRDRVERPTEDQMRAFAAWLSNHHSWYKHLPLVGDGEPFIVYFAPHAHQVWVEHDAGPGGWRDIVDNPDQTWFGNRLKIDLRDGDQLRNFLGSVTQAAKGLTTQRVWTEMNRFSYWNYGRPSQPAADVVASARAGLRVDGDSGQPVAVPEAALWRGLVYLRGTVAPSLGPFEEEYEQLRREHDLPSHEEVRAAQLDAIVAAASAVAAWVYDQA